MTVNIAAQSDNLASRAHDPFEEAKAKLFPPVKNRTVAEAVDALESNQLAITEALLARYLKKKPRDSEALNLMADIARRAKRYEEAENLLGRCVAIAPDQPGYRYNYAIVLRLLHKEDQAIIQLEKLLAADSKNPLFRDQHATVLTGLGRFAEALVRRRELTADYPESADMWLRYGHALRDEGYQEECVAAFHKTLALAPGNAAAWGSLADLKVYKFSQAEIERMEAASSNPTLSADDRATLHHALGTAHRDVKNYAKSFENYAKGNALRRLKIDFDSDKLGAHRIACERFFDTRFFAERAGWGCQSKGPIFIVGMPRSGSTLLEQILTSHSMIEGLGERADLDLTLLRPLSGTKEDINVHEFANGAAVLKSGLVDAYRRIIDSLDAEGFRTLGEQFLALAGRSKTSARPYFTDKTLRNFFYVGLIHLMLPNAKIIDARRHPLDTGWSCFRSQFPGMNFAFRLADIGKDYSNYVRLMDHFDRVLPGRIYRVIYERLIDDPQTELARLFAYLEIPFEESCLSFHENRRAVKTQSSEQVRQPLYKSGMAQWVPYEPWLGPLKSALGPVLECYPAPPPPDEHSAASPNSGTAG
ncbi:MAG TPA: sulfotransferase [Rhizomicrobium sp.]|jgi:tetratricopeptide (TPR) repeat protein|nr:sulfotransferase [Rhizomicrobium sp.]